MSSELLDCQKKKKKNLLGDVSLEDSSSLNDPAATVVAA